MIELVGLPAVLGRLEKLIRDFPDKAARALYTSAMATVVPAARTQIRTNNSVFTGELHSRMSAKAGVDGGKPFVDIGALGVRYGKDVEKGSPPHTPNAARILEYVKKKMGKSGMAAVFHANRIARTIKLVGTKPHPYLRPAWAVSAAPFYSGFATRLRTAIGSP